MKKTCLGHVHLLLSILPHDAHIKSAFGLRACGHLENSFKVKGEGIIEIKFWTLISCPRPIHALPLTHTPSKKNLDKNLPVDRMCGDLELKFKVRCHGHHSRSL